MWRPFALRIVTLTLLGAAVGCRAEETPASNGKKGPPPARVEVATVASGSIEDSWQYLGQVDAALAADLAAGVGGHVVSVKGVEGDRVKKHALLVALDAKEARAVMTSARARLRGLEVELTQAVRQLGRVRGLAEEGRKRDIPAVSDAELDQFQLAVDSLKAQIQTQRAEVERASATLAKYSIRAPFNGVIASRQVDPGAWVDTGDTVLRLVSLGELEIHVDVSAELGGQLEVGQKATLVGRDRAMATIRGIVPALDAETRTMRIRLVPEEPPPWLIAGMTVNVEFGVTFGGDGVVVPTDALVRGPVSTRVVVVREGRGESVKVEVLASAKDRALVKADGLAPGDRVITRGNERLRPGQPLEIVGGDKSAGSAPKGEGAAGKNDGAGDKSEGAGVN